MNTTENANRLIEHTPTRCAVSALVLAFAILLLAAAPESAAWPFSRSGTTSGSLTTQNEHLAVQLDDDRMLEFFAGGTSFVDHTPNGTLTNIKLPLPDFDPYQANDPQVAFVAGRGDAGDLDGDGDIDFVSSCILSWGGSKESGNCRIMSYRNEGDGATWSKIWQFKSVWENNSNINGAPTLKLADLDRDGDLDLIETFGSVRVRWNPGNGDFSGTPTPLFSGFKPSTVLGAPSLEVGDFDGNGWTDIAVFFAVTGLDPDLPLATTGRLAVLSNNGGTFSASTIYTSTIYTDFLNSCAADINQDGKVDLIASLERYSGGYDLLYFRNTGSGFASPSLLLTQSSGFARFTVGDLNEDGIPDLGLATGSDQVKWLRGTGNGVFAPLETLIEGSDVVASQGLVIADVDGDGDQDIFFHGSSYLGENTAIHRKARASSTAMSGTQPSGQVALAVGDINHDGMEDLVVGDGGGGRLLWYAGNGNGLGAGAFVSTGGRSPTSVATGDFNGDGWTDIAYATPSDDTLTINFSGNGSGFSWVPTAVASMSGITRIQAADMEGDGDLDILSASETTIRWHVNNGDGSVWLPQTVASGQIGLKDIACAQEIPGGRQEIAVLQDNAGSGFLIRFRHNGVGWVSAVQPIPASADPASAVAFADIQDATPGLETLFALGNNPIQFHHRSMPGAVTAASTSNPVRDLAAVDWNRDGHPDILATLGSQGLYLFVSRGVSGWGTGESRNLFASDSQAAIPIHLNGDGLADAVVASASGALHLIFNKSAEIGLHASTKSPVSAYVGSTAEPFSVTGSHYGEQGDAAAAPANLSFRFLRSVNVSGNEEPGTPLNQAEIDALIESVALRSNGATLHSAAPSGSIQGTFTLFLPNAVRSQLALSSGTRNFQPAVKLKPTAASAGANLQRFFVQYSPASGWVPLDEKGNSGTDHSFDRQQCRSHPIAAGRLPARSPRGVAHG
ncbi:MAG: VCBS repeat-containing protein [Verrucomicrobiales bacterium]